MVVVYYGGALGNKMFEYACAYVINKEYKDIDVKFFDTLKNVMRDTGKDYLIEKGLIVE